MIEVDNQRLPAKSSGMRHQQSRGAETDDLIGNPDIGRVSSVSQAQPRACCIAETLILWNKVGLAAS
jgi:hypothetical protein